MLQPYPRLAAHDDAVVAEVAVMRTELAAYLQVSSPWTARVLRTARAAAVRASVSLAGLEVPLDDADAALDDVEPLTAAPASAAAVRAYGRAHAFALAAADALPGGAPLDATALRALRHLLQPDGVPLAPAPAPAPVADVLAELHAHRAAGAVVRGAMVHLHLATARPCADGNGRLARLAHAWVLAADGVPGPEVDGLAEWLGDHPDDYRRALVAGDAHLWVAFVLRAHHLQAQVLRGRWYRALQAYADLDGLVAEHRLPDRATDSLYTALLGFRLRRAAYVAATGVDIRTASRDLKAMADANLLRAVGATTGRHYVRGAGLDAAAARLGRPTPLTDPYPDLPATLRATAGD